MRMRTALGLAAALSLSGCGESRALPAVEQVPESSPATAAHLAHTPGGVGVQLDPAPASLDTGMATLRIALDPAPDDGTPVTIDLASPTMPSHGIRRVEAARTASGRYRATLHVPMAGAWALYVNVGSDAEAAEFLFDVAGDPSAHGHAAHGAPAP